MKMNDTVARIVEIMFQDVEMNEETAAIRDEVMDNCQARYQDLVNSGMTEDDAVAAVIESLKGMEDVLAPYKKKVRRHAEDEGMEALEDMDAEEAGEQNMAFQAKEIHQLSVSLVNEDITLEASDDDDYHVIWDADENPLVNAEMVNGVLKVYRRPGETVKQKRTEKIEFLNKDDLSDFIKTEEGKIEINMDSISRAMKSLGDKIKMQFSNGMSIGFGTAGSEVTIQVPENAIPHVKLQTTSGDIHMDDVALTDLSITSTSGDINVSAGEDQHMERVDMRTTSGDMEISAFADRMDIASTSGDVEVEGRINDLTVNTISGDIDVRADVKNMTFKAVSGDVDLEFDSVEIREVRGSTISGDIGIDLPDGIGAIGIHTQTRSGDVTTRHHCDGIGPMVNGSVTSMSGDITIR
ncbi:MAG: DUF4097 family beta strand repeat protein [Clostridia bacterium]|nr:DUF4097 family beta strand repeat protein [Clostridia bacterium]